MANYAVAVVGVDVGVIGGAICALRTGARSARLQELWIAVIGGAGTVGECSLIKSNTLGTATTSVLGQAEDPASPPSTTNVDTAWSAEPGITASEYLRWPGAATVTPGPSANFAWYDRGPVIPPNSSVVLRSLNNIAQMVVTWVWSEEE